MKKIKLLLLSIAVGFLFVAAFVNSENGVTGFYNDITDEFAVSEVFPLVFQTKTNMFHTNNYDKIKQLSSALKNISGVSSVLSVSTAQILSGNGDDLCITPISLGNEREVELKLTDFSDIYENLLYSTDRKSGLIILRLFNNVYESDFAKVSNDVGKIIKQYADSDFKVYRFGTPPVITLLKKQTVRVAFAFPLILIFFTMFTLILQGKNRFEFVVLGLVAYFAVLNAVLLLKFSVFLVFPMIAIFIVVLILKDRSRCVFVKPGFAGVILTLVLTCGGFVGVIVKSATIYDIYKSEDEFKNAAVLMDDKLSGCMVMDIVAASSSINSSDFLMKMDDLKTKLRSETGKIIILSDFIKMMNRAFFYGKQEFYQIPIFNDLYKNMDFNDSSAIDLLITQYLFLYQGTLDEFTTPDLIAPKKVRSTVFIKGDTTDSGMKMKNKINAVKQKAIDSLCSNGGGVRFTGLTEVECMTNVYVTIAGFFLVLLWCLFLLFFADKKYALWYLFLLLLALFFTGSSITFVVGLLVGLLLLLAIITKNPFLLVVPAVLLVSGIGVLTLAALIGMIIICPFFLFGFR